MIQLIGIFKLSPLSNCISWAYLLNLLIWSFIILFGAFTIVLLVFDVFLIVEFEGEIERKERRRTLKKETWLRVESKKKSVDR